MTGAALAANGQVFAFKVAVSIELRSAQHELHQHRESSDLSDFSRDRQRSDLYRFWNCSSRRILSSSGWNIQRVKTADSDRDGFVTAEELKSPRGQ